MVVRAERLTHREHQRRHIIVDRVLDGKAQRQPDHPGAAQYRAKQCGCTHDLQAQNDTARNENDPDSARHQFGQERIGRDPSPERAPPREHIAQRTDQKRHQQRNRDQRQHLDKTAQLAGDAPKRRIEIVVDRQAALKLVAHDHHAGQPLRNCSSLLDCGGIAHRAVQRDHAR